MHTSSRILMANAQCRICDQAADAGAYCSSCAADIMAKAINPFYAGRRKKLPVRHEIPQQGKTTTHHRPSAQPPLFRS